MEGHEKYLSKDYDGAITLYMQVVIWSPKIFNILKADTLGIQSGICTCLLKYMFSEAFNILESSFEEILLNPEQLNFFQGYNYLTEQKYVILKKDDYVVKAVDLMISILTQYFETGKIAVPSPLSFRFYSNKDSRYKINKRRS
jgi:hypothetical protein